MAAQHSFSCVVNCLLNPTKKPLDYCYHIADICCLFSTYQLKARALSTIKTFLDHHHLRLTNRFTLKVLHTYDLTTIKRWARRTISQAGTTRPNWVRFTLVRLQVPLSQ